MKRIESNHSAASTRRQPAHGPVPSSLPMGLVLVGLIAWMLMLGIWMFASLFNASSEVDPLMLTLMALVGGVLFVLAQHESQRGLPAALRGAILPGGPLNSR